MSRAVTSSTVVLQIKIPPKAEIGSEANAAVQAACKVFFVATPQAFVCFKMAKVGLSFKNSRINRTAPSTSTKLL